MDVDWEKAAEGAARVMKPGGFVSLNIWTSSEAEMKELEAIFKKHGFQDVKLIGSGTGTMVVARGPP